MKQTDLTFDVAYTSVLKRAIKTLYYVQEELDLHWIPVYKTWRLNERMYGGLQGLNKSETAAKYGEAQVKVRPVKTMCCLREKLMSTSKIWRRAYDIPPPIMDETDPELPEKDPKYAVNC